VIADVGEERTEAVVERARQVGIEASNTVVEGTPAEAVVDEARDSDVVIMGTHGRTGLDRYLIGSTTEKVVRTADVPVVGIPVAATEETAEAE
jgi:nucleotide-binding universal stress UspA family protein